MGLNHARGWSPKRTPGDLERAWDVFARPRQTDRTQRPGFAWTRKTPERNRSVTSVTPYGIRSYGVFVLMLRGYCIGWVGRLYWFSVRRERIAFYGRKSTQVDGHPLSAVSVGGLRVQSRFFSLRRHRRGYAVNCSIPYAVESRCAHVVTRIVRLNPCAGWSRAFRRAEEVLGLCFAHPTGRFEWHVITCARLARSSIRCISSLADRNTYFQAPASSGGISRVSPGRYRLELIVPWTRPSRTRRAEGPRT